MGRSPARGRTSARIAGLLAAALLAPGLWTAAASAASAPSAASAGSLITATALSAPQGGTITISGNVSVSTVCPSGAAVQLTSAPAQPGTNLFTNGLGPMVPRDASGNFRATFMIPASTPVGSYTIGLRCGDTTIATTQTLNVTAGPHSTPSITASPASAHPGDGLTIAGLVPTTGNIFCPATDATRLTSTAPLFPPDGLGPQVPRDATGNFHVTFTIPATTPPGKYTIGVRCGGGNVSVTATIQVTATAPTTTTTTTTTTTVAESTTTTSTTSVSSAPTTAVAPTTATPATTNAPGPSTTSKKSKGSAHTLRWVALGALGLIVIAGAAVALGHRGRTPPPLA
jgi:hypothetical protein